jgi:hypothetical protein
MMQCICLSNGLSHGSEHPGIAPQEAATFVPGGEFFLNGSTELDGILIGMPRDHS